MRALVTAIVGLAWAATIIAAPGWLLAARRPAKDFCTNPPLVEPVKKLLSLKYDQQWRPITVSDLPRRTNGCGAGA